MASVLGTSHQDTFPNSHILLDGGFEDQLYTDYPFLCIQPWPFS